MSRFNLKNQLTPQTMDTNSHPFQLTNNHSTFSNFYIIHSLGLNTQYQINKQLNSYNQVNGNQEDQSRNLFSNRAEINTRQNYIFKVLGDKYHQSLPSIKQQNVFIFDWDDTLLCTNYISSNKLNSIGPQYQQILNSIDCLCLKILKSAIQKGILFIISNSSKNWLTYSSNKYLPKTNQIIWKDPKIKILSARDLYQQKYPQNILKWKVQTFKRIKQHISLLTITNMICIGDSQDQMIASQLLAKDFKQIYLKKIKLQPRPSPQQLLKQLQTLDRKFQDVYSAVISTSIKLTKKIISQQKIKWKNSDKINKKWLSKQC